MILKTLAGVPVMIALEVTPKLQNAFSLDDQNMTPFLTALAKGLKGIADDHISAEVIALFANGDKYHLAIAIVSSDSGHDIKTALKPFMSYLDLSKHFEMRGAKMGFIIRLVEKVNIWVENDAAERKKVIRVQRVKKNTDNLTLIFPDTEIDATGYGRFRHFVALSELLYCTQIQLNETEFTENDGILTINTTKPPFSVSDYRKMSPTQARVCVSQYLRNSKPSHSTAVQLSYLVIMLYLSTVVILFRLR